MPIPDPLEPISPRTFFLNTNDDPINTPELTAKMIPTLRTIQHSLRQRYPQSRANTRRDSRAVLGWYSRPGAGRASGYGRRAGRRGRLGHRCGRTLERTGRVEPRAGTDVPCGGLVTCSVI